MRLIKDDIISILENHKSEVDNFNDAVFETDFQDVADEILKLSQEGKHYEVLNKPTRGEYEIPIPEININEYQPNEMHP